MASSEITTFLVIRHGETVWNAQQRVQGHGDSPLTANGRRQVEALARRLTRVAFDTLISSDLGRARETAGIIAAATGHAIQADQRLRERNYGILEGMSAPEIKARYPNILDRLLEGDPDCTIPRGESYRQFFRRCSTCIEALRHDHRGQRIALVAHGGVLDVLFHFIAGLPKGGPRCFTAANASLNIISHGRSNRPHDWLIETWGDVSHISG